MFFRDLRTCPGQRASRLDGGPGPACGTRFACFGAPSELLGAGGDAWAAAGRAAVALEAEHDAVWELSGAGAWSARDVAELAAVVPLLDADLAGRLPTAWVGARRQLADPVTHGLVRLAADELATQLRGRGQEP